MPDQLIIEPGETGVRVLSVLEDRRSVKVGGVLRVVQSGRLSNYSAKLCVHVHEPGCLLNRDGHNAERKHGAPAKTITHRQERGSDTE